MGGEGAVLAEEGADGKVYPRGAPFHWGHSRARQRTPQRSPHRGVLDPFPCAAPPSIYPLPAHRGKLSDGENTSPRGNGRNGASVSAKATPDPSPDPDPDLKPDPTQP